MAKLRDISILKLLFGGFYENFQKVFALVVFALSLSAQGFAEYDQSLQTCDNYYVQPGGVYVAPDGIFVMFDGNLIQVDMLCADANGVYVPGIEMSRELVFCPFCRRWFTPEKINDHNCKGHP